MRLPHILLFIAGGAIMAPPPAYPHGSDSVQAQLIRSGRHLELDLIADYGANPLLPTRSEAEAALPQMLRLVTTTDSHPLSSLAAPQLAERHSYHPSSPQPLDPQSTDHSLIGALWSISPTAESFHFQVPADSIHNVLLWEQTASHQPPRWIMLLGGDRSIQLTLPPQPLSPLLLTLGALIAASSFLLLSARIPSQLLSGQPAESPPQ